MHRFMTYLTIIFGCYLGLSPSILSAETDWSVFQETQPKECWAASTPKARVISPNTSQNVRRMSRTEVLLMAVFRPDAEVTKFISFFSGYKIKSNSSVTLSVRGQKYSMLFDKNWAWPAGGYLADEAILDALIRANSATVTISSNNSSEETFSLRGFSAAWQEAQRLCR